ncbi:MAG: AEC family transporter, partial [Oscillospiraceae bacterium]
VIAPIFFMLSLGYLIKTIHIIDQKTVDVMNKVTFKVLLPILLFNSIYKTQIVGAFRPKLIITAIVSVVAVFVFLCIVIPLIEKENKRRGVLIQAIFRSNFVIFGLPISIALCGEQNVGPTAILIAIVVPIYNALSVVALEIFKDKTKNVKKSAIILRILKGIATNPLIIAAALGVIAMLLKIQFPSAIDKSISSISSIGTPLSLILLGATFSFGDTKGYKKQLSIGILGKLIFVPLICIPIFIALGFRDVELVALTVMIAAPTAVSTYTIAHQMNADAKLAGQLVVYDSIFSILTMFLWVFCLKNWGLF